MGKRFILALVAGVALQTELTAVQVKLAHARSQESLLNGQIGALTIGAAGGRRAAAQRLHALEAL